MAPNGGGKTSSLAIPNLFFTPCSHIENDKKRTSFEKTSGYRKNILGHKVFKFDPANRDLLTHCYNPFTYVSSKKHLRLADIQIISHSLIYENAYQKGEIWIPEARSLFEGLILMLLDLKGNCTLSALSHLVRKIDFDQFLRLLMSSKKEKIKEAIPYLSGYLNIPEKTRGGILTQLKSVLGLFLDPLIASSTKKSDFDFRDLRKEKTTIYICYDDKDQNRLTPLLTLFYQQALMNLMQKPKEDEPYSVNITMDEFGNLGRMEDIRSSLNLLREYKVRLIIIVQYLGQLREKYNEAESGAFRAIKTKIFYRQSSLEDSEYVSKLLGDRTVEIQSYGSHSSKQGDSTSSSTHVIGRPLLTGNDIRQMRDDYQIIVKDGISPILAQKLFYFKDKKMLNYSRIQASSVPTQEPYEKNDVAEENDTKLPIDEKEILREKIRKSLL